MSARDLITTNIAAIIETFDAHDVGIETWNHDTYRCHCGWRGTAEEWQQHLARAIGERIEPAVQEALL